MGAILIFLPGWADIRALQKRLTAPGAPFATSDYAIHALHSQVAPGVQRQAFDAPRRGSRKIVLATNVAEAAVTIPDVVYVINSGQVKEKSHNEATGVSALNGQWISRASERQRRGRAGRLRPGICYHMYSRAQSAAFEVGIRLAIVLCECAC
jgi:ATP-dependent RNA helicase DHX36